MDLQFFSDERSVSPVIGVILMVAITVILAAVIAAFVMGLGDDATADPQPTAQFEFEYDRDTNDLTISHAGGDSVDSERIYLRGENLGTTGQWAGDTSGPSSTVQTADA